MKIIVGLGNPGKEYGRTRHNVGYQVVDALAARLGVTFSQEKYRGLIAKARYQVEEVLLVKPLTYMNLSGDCVARVMRYTTAELEDLLIVADDVNLPLAKLRIRAGGSAGGHNGLKSIFDHLGTQEVARLRIGVGQCKADGGLTGHVLGAFGAEERPDAEAMVEKAVEAALAFVSQGLAKAMNVYNAKNVDPGE